MVAAAHTRKGRRLALCVLLWAVMAAGAAATSPQPLLIEDAEFQAAQEAAAPVGRPDYQARALAEFAAGLAADPSGFLPLWTGDTHPCGDASNNFRAWPGLVCDAPGGHVTAIALRSKGLVGRLPDSLSVLKSVRLLDLSNNSFQGSIPGSWSNLTSLESADLSRNALTGPLPPSFASLFAIQTLDVHSNNLSGSLPATWASMSMLEVLDVSHNLLTSSLPAAWAQLMRLSVLNLNGNELTGTLPPAWAAQRSLLQLNVGSNRIQGTLPSQWARGMESLRGINATDNQMQGPLPQEWSNMTSLQTLAVGANQLTGSVPVSWSNLHQLFAVNVTRNSGMCGSVPSAVSRVLKGDNTSLDGHCMWAQDADVLLAFKAGLRAPDEAGDPLPDWRPDSNPCGAAVWQGVVCKDGLVAAVWLQDRGLRGALQPGLASMSQLQEVQLRGNMLTGVLPESWGSESGAHNLVAIDLAHNRLEGTLPASWGNMTSLAYLDLSHNELGGGLADDWQRLRNLSTLLLGGNKGLNGTLPASWASLQSLQTVHLEEGNLTGRLPSSWGKLALIKDMRLSSNALTGSVPASWSTQLDKLQVLDLSGNQRMCGDAPSISSPAPLVHTSSTGLGQDCSLLAGDTQQLSGWTGVAIGVCLGVVGTVVVAGAAFLVVQARRGQLERHAAKLRALAPPHSRAPSTHPSCSGKGSPAVSRPPSCLPTSPSRPPPALVLPGLAGAAAAPPSPSLRVLQPPGSPTAAFASRGAQCFSPPTSPVPGSPTAGGSAPAAPGQAAPGPAGGAPHRAMALATPPRALSPLGFAGAAGGGAAGLPFEVLAKCPSLVDSSACVAADAADGGAAASAGKRAGAGAPGERSISLQLSSPDPPLCVRGLPSSPGSSPSRHAGLKLHVASVLRSSAAASGGAAALGAGSTHSSPHKLQVQEGVDSDAGGSSAASSEVASPRGTATLLDGSAAPPALSRDRLWG